MQHFSLDNSHLLSLDIHTEVVTVSSFICKKIYQLCLLSDLNITTDKSFTVIKIY